MEVHYVPGKDNIVEDALSPSAYPAWKAFSDVSIHGGAQNDQEIEQLIQEEHDEEMVCQDAEMPEQSSWEGSPLEQ